MNFKICLARIFGSKKRGDAGPSSVIVVIVTITGSIILAAGVVLYGTSLFQGGAQQESITVSGMKLWVHGGAADGLGWGAFTVRNTGDKVLSVDKITVRGQDVPFAQWYPDANVTSSLLQQPVLFSGWKGSGGMMANTTTSLCSAQNQPQGLQIIIQAGQTNDEGTLCANAAAGPLGLDPGQGAVVYFKLSNGTVNTVDGGAQTSVSVFAGKVGAPQSISISSKT